MPTSQAEFPEQDPRLLEDDPQTRDPFFAHEGYSYTIPGHGPSYYTHEASGRKLSREEYRRETAPLTEAMDRRYHPEDFED